MARSSTGAVSEQRYWSHAMMKKYTMKGEHSSRKTTLARENQSTSLRERSASGRAPAPRPRRPRALRAGLGALAAPGPRLRGGGCRLRTKAGRLPDATQHARSAVSVGVSHPRAPTERPGPECACHKASRDPQGQRLPPFRAVGDAHAPAPRSRAQDSHDSQAHTARHPLAFTSQFPPFFF